MSTSKRFTKITYDGKKVKLKWETPTEGDRSPNEFQLKSEIAPHPDFKDAMRTLGPHWGRLLGLPDTYVESARVYSVQIGYKEGRVHSTILTAKKLIDTAVNPAVISTPTGIEINGQLTDALWALCEEADAFVDGKDGEAALFDEDEEQQAELEPA